MNTAERAILRGFACVLLLAGGALLLCMGFGAVGGVVMGIGFGGIAWRQVLA